jgi:chlorobactene glucosyltransferase
MDSLNLIILILLVLLFFNLLKNLNLLEEQENLCLSGHSPLISILLPARNEEEIIKKCVLSLLAQDYPHFEVLVLDDDSTDRTGQILQDLAEKHKELKVIKGMPLPQGWLGKAWACHQLSRRASGKWLLFTDADTVHGPSSISTAMAASRKNSSDFLSCIPKLEAKSWSEHLYMPIIHVVFYVLIPFHMMNYLKLARMPFAMGPFMLIKRKIFDAIGGYKTLKTSLVDDLTLARAVKAQGGRITVFDGSTTMKLRFYTSFKELWSGFSKNSYEAIEKKPHFAAGIFLVSYFLLIYPYLSLLGAIEANQGYFMPVCQVGVICLTKVVLALRFRTNLIYAILNPLTVILALLILFNSLRLALFKKKVEWKERFYPVE